MTTSNLIRNTITCPLPGNITPMSPNGFNFTITKLPDLSFFCQQVTLPALSIGAPEQSTPFSTTPIPGEIATFDQLQVQFLVDSEMKNYKAIHNWLVALSFPQNYEQYTNFTASDTNQYSELAKNYSDGSLSMLDGTNNIAATVQFVDLFPLSLEGLTFQSTNTDVQYLVGNATFRYTYYKFL
jgi:hypothetical protein